MKVVRTTQCKGCWYWRGMAGAGVNACHYRMVHESGAAKADGVCLSRTEEPPRLGKKEWPIYETGETALAGYQRGKKN